MMAMDSAPRNEFEGLQATMQIDESTSSEISCGETLWTLPIQRARSEAVGSSSNMKQQRAVDKHRAHQASLPCMADELELCAGAIEEEQWWAIAADYIFSSKKVAV
jgi:hypothetical protein